MRSIAMWPTKGYLRGGSEFLDDDEPFAAVDDALDCRQFAAADADETVAVTAMEGQVIRVEPTKGRTDPKRKR
jgi:hypothetical protein